ncbi:hypothetical protein GE21DRAFT_1167242, partial [Neurospora crassa]
MADDGRPEEYLDTTTLNTCGTDIMCASLQSHVSRGTAVVRPDLNIAMSKLLVHSH